LSKKSHTNIARRGLLLVLSSPSGAGKTTLSRKLLEADPSISMSVSVTTRAQRPGEQDGRDYHFITKEKFAQLRDAGELLEYAEVFGNFYGTPRKPVEQALQAGKDVLFDIDWQGTQQLAQVMEEDLVRVFILPPSAEMLRERLINRQQDSMSVVAKRMAEASSEISHWAEYEYVIVNDDLTTASQAITAILTAERLKRKRRTGLTAFVRELLSGL
jgi:guanylate kinase